MKKALPAIIVFCLAIAGAAYGSPKIHVEEPIYDFGSVLEGFAVTHAFTLRNTGSETLEIYRVAASCGCTTTQLATDRLAPGGSVELEVLVDTAGFGGHGISKSIYVYCNDPDYADASSSDRPRFTLRVAGEVIRAQPYHVSISDMNYLFTLLVDLRDPTAYEEARLIGAVNVPLAAVAESLDLLPPDALIVLIDQDGAASPQAAADLAALGYTTVYYAVGGMDEWTRWYGTFFLEIAADPFETPGREGRSRLACPEEDRQCTDAAELRYLVYLLIDLREPEAYRDSHLFGAINIPYTEISRRLDDLPKDVLTIVYDQAGEQSDAIAQMMLNAGFSQARSLLGGLDEWVRQYADRFVVPDPE
jgi:rhodanese-related sulfurtransferase